VSTHHLMRKSSNCVYFQCLHSETSQVDIEPSTRGVRRRNGKRHLASVSLRRIVIELKSNGREHATTCDVRAPFCCSVCLREARSMPRSLIIITILIEIMFWAEIERAPNQSSETLVPRTAKMPVDIIGTRQALRKAEKQGDGYQHVTASGRDETGPQYRNWSWLQTEAEKSCKYYMCSRTAATTCSRNSGFVLPKIERYMSSSMDTVRQHIFSPLFHLQRIDGQSRYCTP
jgi:hypothetical protein